MKKIVGILTAAAVMATSVFAADISAKAKIDGSLFNWDGTNVSALSIKHGNEDWNPNIALSVSGDKAGASFKFYDNARTDNNFTNVATGYSIWFKPADILKVTVGSWGTNLNQEHIGWCNTDSGIDSYGYALNVSTNGVSADLFFAPGWETKWFQGGANSVADTYFKVQYGADFGTVNAMFYGKNTFNEMRFGAGYNGKAGPVAFWVNGLGFVNNGSFAEVEVEADVATALGPVAWEMFVAGGYKMVSGYDPSWWHVGNSGAEGAFVGLYTKFSTPVAGANVWLEIKDTNFLADAFAMNIKPGVDVSVGTCAIQVALDMNINGGFTLDVPVSFTVNF